MKSALLFDIDSTLTPPRLPITKDMVDKLNRLKAPFHVAAGSHMELLENQFFEPLREYGFKGQFEAFISNGALHYHCDYQKTLSLSEVDLFDIQVHLGRQLYDSLIATLLETIEMPAFKLPPSIQVYGDTIAYRVSMVNFSPIGRVKIETPEVRANRDRFVRFDHETNYRRNILAHYEALELISKLEAEKKLRITLGGQTSFDVGILEQDKTKAVKVMLESGVERLIFIGDALYEGGNDAVVREYIDAMPDHPGQKAEYHQVASYKDTIDLLEKLGFL